ncbi:MAG: galactose oxidase [Leptospira sp.]|nr:MAG: galactose oxidase [Leptospira sp.]
MKRSLSQFSIRFILRLCLFSLVPLGLFSCGSDLFTSGSAAQKARVNFFFVPLVSETSALVYIECSAKVVGFVRFKAENGGEQVSSSIFPSETHFIPINNFPSDTNIEYQVFCGLEASGIGIPASFRSSSSLRDIFYRSFWMVGGTGSDKTIVADLDFYDPVAKRWYPSYTKIPTPRANAQIVSHKGRIYIIGGLILGPGGIGSVASPRVEVYDPLSNTWSTLANIPSNLQGAVVGSIDDEIFLISGSTSADMTTGTIFNNVYRFNPSLGANGVWNNYLSSTNIFPRTDLAYCTYNGSLIFSGGRFYADGTAQSTSDAFIPSANSTSGRIEASISIARHGLASACYKPRPSDPFPNDQPLFLVAGGSTSTNILQPVDSVTTSNRFEYSILGTNSNVFVTGSNIPVALYAPAMEIDYTSRKAFLFGGASEINLPSDNVYSLELTNPGLVPWVLVDTKMPKARFGHKVIILNR